MSLPPCSSGLEDNLLWHFDKSGSFSIRSEYWVANDLRTLVALRNQVVHSNVKVPNSDICGWVTNYIQEFRVTNKDGQRGGAGDATLESATKGMFKINTDAALRFCDKVYGIGVVIRDSNGLVMAILCQNINVNYHPQIANALAILKGIWLTQNIGRVPIVLELDALSVVNSIVSKEVPNIEVGVRVHDVLCLLKDAIYFVPRLANTVAHGLARLTLDQVGEFVWLEDCPLFIDSLILDD
ncbi:hypothetical protein Dsin_031796 [Dipteronia sinensis]|uniref:RNase H type-1 domain-containing protein n=1 Tax=Dipteronia sinensis TaxID=43782 RepID=A0AAD9ZM85_9ROSI|nr:hypothetical protein Dsin_031796 [Dipteronia sinensis]